MNPYFFIGAAAVGVVAFIGLSIFNAFTEQRQNHHQYAENNDGLLQREEHARNLTCPFCGRGIARGDYRLSCGHICHKSCYDRAPHAHRRCRFCRDLNETIDNESTNSNANLRQRNITASCDTTTRDNHRSGGNAALNTLANLRRSRPTAILPNSSRDSGSSNRSAVARKTSENVQSHMPAVSAPDVAMICSFCEITLESEEAVRLPCFHLVHSECHKTYATLLKCPECATAEQSNDS